MKIRAAASAFLIVVSGMSVASPATAAVTKISGYQSCPAGQYVAIQGWVNSQQTVSLYFSNRYSAQRSTQTVFVFNTLRNSGTWEVRGPDLSSANDYCYTPRSGPAGTGPAQ